MSEDTPSMQEPPGIMDMLALARQKLWEEIGMPVSPKYMTEESMNRDYRGRFSCINQNVLDEAQHALKFIACPRCVVRKPHGEIAVTRFHIGIQDDVMTVFKAMARCFCYNCAFEEFWPLSRDPRINAHEEMTRQRAELMRNYQQNRGGVLGGAGGAGLGNMGMAGHGVARGIGMNPLGAMQSDEMQALQRLYDHAKNRIP